MKKDLVTATFTVIALTLSLSTPIAAKSKNYDRNNERYDYAKVINTQAIYETVSYSRPYESCHIEEHRVSQHSESSTPIIIGGILGAAIGNKLSRHKRNKHINGFAGALLGGAIARDLGKKNHKSHRQQIEVCNTAYDIETREELIGYEVVYRYHGVNYTTFADHHPGKRIRVNTTVRPVFDS